MGRILTRIGAGHQLLTLLAMDLNGWGSLCRLSSAANASLPADRGRAGVTFEQLAQDAAGVPGAAHALGPADGGTLAP